MIPQIIDYLAEMKLCSYCFSLFIMKSKLVINRVC